MLGLYLHVPFCEAICSYCNFNRGLHDDDLRRRYVDALAREVSLAGDGREADTIFFGGGTPSLLEPAEVRRLISVCRDAFSLADDAEITLETNPETATPTRLAAFRSAGVNRISFGVQSFDDQELRRLGRIHTARRAATAFRDARIAGFENLSLDLMLWLPGQSPASWDRTVERAVELDPDHVSLYLLELYPNAPLRETMARSSSPDFVQTSDDDAADMYLDGLSRLDRAGYHQYEISNVARPGRQSRHNLKYWRAGDWRGFGCGAHSTVGPARWRNVSSTTDYVARVTDDRGVAVEMAERPHAERVSEALFTGLRLSEGIDRGNFFGRFGVEPWLEYGRALAPLVSDGLVWVDDDRFGLSRRGMLVANEILSVFV